LSLEPSTRSTTIIRLTASAGYIFTVHLCVLRFIYQCPAPATATTERKWMTTTAFNAYV